MTIDLTPFEYKVLKETPRSGDHPSQIGERVWGQQALAEYERNQKNV